MNEQEATLESNRQRVFTLCQWLNHHLGLVGSYICLYEHCFSTRPSKAGDE